MGIPGCLLLHSRLFLPGNWKFIFLSVTFSLQKHQSRLLATANTQFNSPYISSPPTPMPLKHQRYCIRWLIPFSYSPFQFISHNSPARSGQQGSSTPWCHLETLVSSARLLCCLLRCHPHLHRWEWQQLTSRWAEEKKSQSVKMLFVSKSEMICT